MSPETTQPPRTPRKSLPVDQRDPAIWAWLAVALLALLALLPLQHAQATSAASQAAPASAVKAGSVKNDAASEAPAPVRPAAATAPAG